MAALSALRSRTGDTGFTLVELIITVTIVGVLAAIAAPSMRELVLTQYVRSAATDLRSALNFARSEAIKRAANVLVVPVGNDWLNGWTVQDAGGVVLRRQNALNAQLLAMSGSTITYRNDGRLTAPVLDIVFKTSNGNVTARCVTMDLGGRPTIVYDTDGDPTNGCN